MRNDRDNEVLNDSPRLLPVGLPPNTNVPGLKSLQLQASSVIFKTDAAGAVVGSTSILLTANLRAITGTPVFTVKSGTATLSAGAGPETRTLQFANMSTDHVVIEVSVEDTSTFKPTGGEPNAVYTDEIMIAKISDGSMGQDGEDGGTGPRTATGYLYYQYSTSSAPTKPSASSFNFSSGTFGNLTSNWSSTPPTFQAGNSNRYWYVYYAVRELSYGGSQTVAISNSSQGIGFSGLVTFSGTSLTNGSTSFNYTQIDGGWIKTGTVSANRIDVNNLVAKKMQTATTGDHVVIGTVGIGSYEQDSVYCVNSGGTVAARLTNEGLYLRGTGLAAGGVINGLATISGTAGGFFKNVPGGTWIKLATSSYAYQMVGAAAPFTGAHEGMVLNNELSAIEVGDILVDVDIVKKHSVSDVLTSVARSSRQCQKSCIGVLANVLAPEVPVVFTELVNSYDKNSDISEQPTTYPTAGYALLTETYTPVSVNALGEGQINICGQNGDIEIGDLIVTSDMPGKGMKQDDDIVRNYTVAKSREAVTFSSPEEVKQIACIYLCG
jgi:hypothetical protein